MQILSLISHYVFWHYSQALADIFAIWKNFAWFLYHFFSIPLLFKTFFLPWKHLNEGYHKGFNIGVFFSSLVVNTLMRFVGMIARAVTITAGVVSLSLHTLAGAVVVVLWLFLPLAVVLLAVFGLREIL